MNKKYKMCKDCGKHILYVRQRVRCGSCAKKRKNDVIALCHLRQLGGIPMIVKQHKIVYKDKLRQQYNFESQTNTEQEERNRATLDVGDGQWVREQLYNFRFDIVEFETDQQRKERKLSEYKQWIERNL